MPSTGAASTPGGGSMRARDLASRAETTIAGSRHRRGRRRSWSRRAASPSQGARSSPPPPASSPRSLASASVVTTATSSAVDDPQSRQPALTGDRPVRRSTSGLRAPARPPAAVDGGEQAAEVCEARGISVGWPLDERRCPGARRRRSSRTRPCAEPHRLVAASPRPRTSGRGATPAPSDRRSSMVAIVGDVGSPPSSDLGDRWRRSRSDTTRSSPTRRVSVDARRCLGGRRPPSAPAPSEEHQLTPRAVGPSRDRSPAPPTATGPTGWALPHDRWGRPRAPRSHALLAEPARDGDPRSTSTARCRRSSSDPACSSPLPGVVDALRRRARPLRSGGRHLGAAGHATSSAPARRPDARRSVRARAVRDGRGGDPPRRRRRGGRWSTRGDRGRPHELPVGGRRGAQGTVADPARAPAPRPERRSSSSWAAAAAASLGARRATGPRCPPSCTPRSPPTRARSTAELHRR